MITTRLSLFNFEENIAYGILNLELAEAETMQIIDRCFGGDKLIGEYFGTKFLLCFYSFIQCWIGSFVQSDQDIIWFYSCVSFRGKYVFHIIWSYIVYDIKKFECKTSLSLHFHWLFITFFRWISFKTILRHNLLICPNFLSEKREQICQTNWQ